ncbi:PREDICTED: uncharacterized protein LOC101308346 [Fragaria vesca subsp. vesca]
MAEATVPKVGGRGGEVAVTHNSVFALHHTRRRIRGFRIFKSLSFSLFCINSKAYFLWNKDTRELKVGQVVLAVSRTSEFPSRRSPLVLCTKLKRSGLEVVTLAFCSLSPFLEV